MSVCPVRRNHGSGPRVLSVTSNRDVLWRVPRSVKNLNLDVPKIKHFSIPRAAKIILCIGALVQHIFGA